MAKRKRTEDELERAYAALEDMDKKKKKFGIPHTYVLILCVIIVVLAFQAVK